MSLFAPVIGAPAISGRHVVNFLEEWWSTVRPTTKVLCLTTFCNAVAAKTAKTSPKPSRSFDIATLAIYYIRRHCAYKNTNRLSTLSWECTKVAQCRWVFFGKRMVTR